MYINKELLKICKENMHLTHSFRVYSPALLRKHTWNNGKLFPKVFPKLKPGDFDITLFIKSQYEKRMNKITTNTDE